MAPEEDPKQINSEIPAEPTSQLIPDGLEQNHHSHNQEQEHPDSKCGDQATCSSKIGESEAINDEDDGFRTPTSMDHRIPKLTQCPPAPKKVGPLPPKKRKALWLPSQPPCRSVRSRRGVVVLDLTKHEVDSMFPPRIQEDVDRNCDDQEIDSNI